MGLRMEIVILGIFRMDAIRIYSRARDVIQREESDCFQR